MVCIWPSVAFCDAIHFIRVDMILFDFTERNNDTMEKRALLAFGLILLVWVLYFSPFYQESFLGRKPQSVVTEETSTDLIAPTQSDNQEPGTVSPPKHTNPVSSRPNENWDRDEQLLTISPDSSDAKSSQVVIESDLFRGIIDSKGAVIRSWQLKRYEGVGSSWVELIHEDRGGGPDVLLTSEQGILDFSQSIFHTNKDSLKLSQSINSGAIEFRYNDDSSEFQLIKRYTFNNNNYSFSLDIELLGGDHLSLGNKYIVRWGGGLNVTEPDRNYDLTAFRAFRKVGDEVEELDIGDSEPTSEPLAGTTHWVGVRSKYFFAGIIPESRNGVGSRLSGRPITNAENSDRQISAEIEMELKSGFQDQYLIYLGPVDYDLLADYNKELEAVVDLGWSIVKPISRFILAMMVWLHQWISNYGLVIIVLSIIVKIVLYPLTYKSLVATQGMAKMQPKIEELKQKYKNDVQRLNKEMMKVYKEQGVNPIGGCLPMLLQMPILYALYAIFSSTIELRRAPLGWWIQDLSQKDPLYIFPILMGLTMLLQSKMTMKDPRQAALVYMMPIIMFIFMKDLPSGLIIYWTMINILTIIQQYFQNRFFPTSPANS